MSETTNKMPIPRPDLEIREEDRFAAEAVGKISGGIDADRVRLQIRERQELLKLIENGNLPVMPACPELTNANPGSPHTVIIEAMAWLLSQMGYRIDQIPDQNNVAFHNLFGVELRAARRAETVLKFTTNFPPPGGPNPTPVIITIPLGTQVSDKTGEFVFETTEEAGISASIGFVEVPARRTTAGHCLLAPNVLTTFVDQIAWVNTVTNRAAVDSGTENESIEAALERARQYQQRGERMVSDRDLENAITTEILDNSGIVRVFPRVKNGSFTEEPMLGYSTVVVATSNGFPVSDLIKQRIIALFEQLQGNQYFSIADVQFQNFNVSAEVVLNPGAQISVVRAEAEFQLEQFYATTRKNFGRPILRSEIIAVLESLPGVNYVKPQTGNRILIEPLNDTFISPWQIVKFGSLTLTES